VNAQEYEKTQTLYPFPMIIRELTGSKDANQFFKLDNPEIRAVGYRYGSGRRVCWSYTHPASQTFKSGLHSTLPPLAGRVVFQRNIDD
jgi:hypothetical protein